MIQVELLRDGTEADYNRLLHDDAWVFQEKENGDRRLIQKNPDNTIYDYNRRGESGKGLPPNIIEALSKHPLYQFVIDVELVGTNIFVFDALFLGDENLVAQPYSVRESYYHAQFDNAPEGIRTIYSARTREEKTTLRSRLEKEHAEGLVAKDLRAFYRPSTNNCRYNYRFKFWKDCEAVVIGDSTERNDKGMFKDSVRLGCYDEQGKLQEICGATKKSEFSLAPGTVVTCKYLYGTGERKVVQPTIIAVRNDKLPHECTLDQIIINKNWISL